MHASVHAHSLGNAPVVIQICSASFFINASNRKQRLPRLVPLLARCATTLRHTVSDRKLYTCFAPATVGPTVPALVKNFSPTVAPPGLQKTRLRESEASPMCAETHHSRFELVRACACEEHFPPRSVSAR